MDGRAGAFPRNAGATRTTERSGGSGRSVQQLRCPACRTIDGRQRRRDRRLKRSDLRRQRRDRRRLGAQREGERRQRTVVAAMRDPRRRTVRRRLLRCRRRPLAVGVMRVTRVLSIAMVMRVHGEIRGRRRRPRAEPGRVDAVDVAHLGRRAALQRGGGAGQHRHRALQEQCGDEHPGGQARGGSVSLHAAIVAAVAPSRGAR